MTRKRLPAKKKRAATRRARVATGRRSRSARPGSRPQSALHHSEARLRTIIEQGPECIKVVSPEGFLVDMNPAGLEMLEAESIGQLLDRPLLDRIAPEHRRAFGDLHKLVMSGGTGTLVFESIGLNGGRRWLETRAVPLREG